MALPPTSTKGSSDSNPVTTFEIDFPNQVVTHTGVKASVGTLTIAGGGTGQTAKTAAFDALSPTTTKGDLIANDGTNNIRVPIGSNNNYLIADSGQTSGLAWTSTTQPNYPVTSQTSTYSITLSDIVVLCSGSAFTVTLPTAVGNTGKLFIIEKTDSSFANIITVATTSSQTIGAGGGTSTTLNTQGESLTVYSDGSNWQIQARRIPATLIAYTPTFSPASGTVSNIAFKYSRIGPQLKIYGRMTTTGSGAITISLPSGLSVDDADTTNYKKYGTGSITTAGAYVSSANARGTDTFVTLALIGVGNGIDPYTNWATETHILEYTVPITGWNG